MTRKKFPDYEPRYGDIIVYYGESTYDNSLKKIRKVTVGNICEDPNYVEVIEEPGPDGGQTSMDFYIENIRRNGFYNIDIKTIIKKQKNLKRLMQYING